MSDVYDPCSLTRHLVDALNHHVDQSLEVLVTD
jgi:hypothetical protein